MNVNVKSKLIRFAIHIAIFITILAIDKLILPENVHFLIRAAIYLISYGVVSFNVIKNTVLNAIHGNIFNEEMLMTIAGIGAFAVGEFPEAIMIMFFYEIGEAFQDHAVETSRDSIAELLTLAPETANVIRNGEIITLNSSEVEIGESILVRAGEKVPLDGIIIDGNSDFETSAISGESMPRFLSAGQEVLSPSVNLTNTVTIRVTKKFEDSTATVIATTVENAISQKPKVDKFITRFARYYTPIVCISALLIAIFGPIVSNGTYPEWIHRALMLLVISCPCALVVSIPLTFFMGIGTAAKNGILIKCCNTIEVMKDAEIAVLDKTGTITSGEFKVSRVFSITNNESDLLSLIRSVEEFSAHPIAKAICEELKDHPLVELTNVTEHPGKGMTAQYNDKLLTVGNEALLAENGYELSKHPYEGTPIHVSLDNKYLGYIIVSDVIKPNAKEMIAQLKQLGITQTYMLTGDNEINALTVAENIGITNVRSNLLPSQKHSALRSILRSKSKKAKLIYTGDGINDAECLTSADVGIAMGKKGTDLAINVSDAVIMDDDIAKIPFLVELSQRTMNIMTANIIFVLTVKAAVFVLSIFGISNMWFAIFADVGTLIIAILNTFRIANMQKD